MNPRKSQCELMRNLIVRFMNFVVALRSSHLSIRFDYNIILSKGHVSRMIPIYKSLDFKSQEDAFKETIENNFRSNILAQLDSRAHGSR